MSNDVLIAALKAALAVLEGSDTTETTKPAKTTKSKAATKTEPKTEPKAEPKAESTTLTYEENIKPLLFNLLNNNQQQKVQDIFNTLGIKSGTELKERPDLFEQAYELADAATPDV